MRKFNITVSDCCGAEARLSIGVLSQRFDKDFTCSKCGKLCKTKIISCTPDEDIAEVLKIELNNCDEGDRGCYERGKVNAIVEQLNIKL
jgi:transcription elongation factor Elf1